MQYFFEMNFSTCTARWGDYLSEEFWAAGQLNKLHSDWKLKPWIPAQLFYYARFYVLPKKTFSRQCQVYSTPLLSIFSFVVQLLQSYPEQFLLPFSHLYKISSNHISIPQWLSTSIYSLIISLSSTIYIKSVAPLQPCVALLTYSCCQDIKRL